MAVPKFDTFMRPLLDTLSDGSEHRLFDLAEPIARMLGLTEEDRAERIPSGQSRLRNRIYWAKLHLSQAKAIESLKQGVVQITPRGRALLDAHPAAIAPKDLLQFSDYRDFLARGKPAGTSAQKTAAAETPNEPTAETPDDAITSAYEAYKSAIIGELLNNVQAADPLLLSKIVVKLLIAMGYGNDESGIVLDGPSDGGIDGVVKKDRLGISSIYIQAKRYKDGSNIGAPAIQQFAGSMQERRADEGVFVTTSDFTKQAYESARRLHVRIALINGERLATLMYDQGIGVATHQTYALKRIDSDFFATE